MKQKACLILISFFMGTALSVHAQHTSRLGRFQVDEIKGCAPLTITLTVNLPFKCDSSNPCAAFYDFANSPQVSEPLITPPFTHTYTTPGTYTLSILMGTLMDDIRIEVTPNTPPVFEVYTCGNNEVSVNITDTNYNQYVINYNDASPDVVVPVGNLAKDRHTYVTAGPKTITVRGRHLNADDNCNPATKNITALATLPAPVISQLTVTDNATINLSLNAQPDILYRLEIATNSGTSFQLFKTIYNTATETLSNLKTEDNYYCFRLGAFDPCNNTTVYSPVICSADFDLSVQNNVNNLTWNTSTTGISNFRLIRSSAGSSLTRTPSGSPYGDTEIVCGTEYCYQLTTNYPNGSTSISLQKCGTAMSTDIPIAVNNITAIVAEPGVSVQWQQVIGFTPSVFSVYKPLGNTYSIFTTTSTLQVTDETYTTESAACYKISYADVCGNESPLSDEACPIRLTGSLQTDNSVIISWTPYTGWRDGVTRYVVEKFSQEGQLLQSFDAGASLSFVDDTQDLNNQTIVYVVKADAVVPGLPQAVSNRVQITKDPNLFYPTGFTPNGDNLNDIFNVYGQYIVNFEMNIFNRWGELMYTTADLEQGWDGNFRGNPMPEGTYTFVADITDRSGRSFKKSGSVLLLRKGK